MTLTCRIPFLPCRVNKAWRSMKVSASCTAARCAFSICAAMCGSATAHNVETDLTGEKVRSKPATIWVRGRDCLAIMAAISRASIGSRPCSVRKNSRATSVRTCARSAAETDSSPSCPAAAFGCQFASPPQPEKG